MLKFLIGTYRRGSFFRAEKIFQVELMVAYGLVSVEPSLGLGSQASLVPGAPLGKQRRSIHDPSVVRRLLPSTVATLQFWFCWRWLSEDRYSLR